MLQQALAACAGVLLAFSANPANAEERFEDRLIDPALLDQEDPDLLIAPDLTGPPRSASIEVRAQTERVNDGRRSSSQWVVSRGMLGTDNYGYFTLDASYRLGNQGGESSPFRFLLTADNHHERGAFTLTQRQMPFAGDWYASNALGLVPTSSVDLIAQQYRFGVPSRLVLGVSTEWSRRVGDWQLQGATGEPVSLDLVGQGGYLRLGGRASVASLRWRGDGLAYAAQFAAYDADDLPVSADFPFGFGVGALPSSHGLIQALRREDASTFVQGNLLLTKDARATPYAGAWIDVGIDDGLTEHRFGANRLPHRQQWLGAAMASGTSGGYYRWRWHSRELLTEVQFDRQVLNDTAFVTVGTDHSITQGWGSVRYRLDQGTAIGAQGLVIDVGGQRSSSLLAFRESFSDALSGRVFAGVHRTTGKPEEWQVGADGSSYWQGIAWNAAAALIVASGQSYGSDLSLSASKDLDGRTSFIIAARRSVSVGDTSPALSLNATAQYRLAPGWLLTGGLSESRGPRLPMFLGPAASAPAIDPLSTFAPRVRFAWIGLRYEMTGGSAAVPLGGAPGSGGGRVEGVLFIDANGNGVADAGEARLANVTLILDGRYAIRSDAQGRYEIPFVIPGPHTLTVLPDNVPLPWSFGDAVRRIDVQMRATTRFDLGAMAH
jgi:hypothetical protein